ncbi:MAG: aspartate/glutamate racemase family protein [Thermoprotei archaeon]
MRQVKIGVLGGIGPESSAEYYLKLIKGLQQKNCVHSNPDYPQIIINSVPAREFPVEVDISKDLRDIDQLYITGVKQLDQIGVDFVVIVCNSAHVFYKELADSIKVPILDLRDEVRKELLKRHIHKSVVLGTPWTIQTGLYDFEGITTLKLRSDDILQLYRSIYSFNLGNYDQPKNTVKEMAKRYVEAGAEIVILGCTEVALMLQDEALPVLNTVDVLVWSTIEKFCKLRDG